METRLGQNYEGIISGVTGWGLYVELPNTVEGLVHISTLMDDYYQFDEEAYCLVGEKTGHTYRLGQKVTVKVSQVDLSTKSIDFILKEENSCFNKSTKKMHWLKPDSPPGMTEVPHWISYIWGNMW